MADHRELFDEQYAAELKRLGRRRVMLITIVSSLGGAMIIGGFLVAGWIGGERLTVRKRDQFALVTVGKLSHLIDGLTIRLDQERWRKRRERDGRIKLSYSYVDGPLSIISHLIVCEDETAARHEMSELKTEPLAPFVDRDWKLVPPPLTSTYGDESIFGSLSRDGTKNGHVAIIRVGNKLLLTQIVGQHLVEEQFGTLLTQTADTMDTYEP